MLLRAHAYVVHMLYGVSALCVCCAMRAACCLVFLLLRRSAVVVLGFIVVCVTVGCCLCVSIPCSVVCLLWLCCVHTLCVLAPCFV